MDRMKLLGVIGLVSIALMIVLTAVSFAGVGVESQLLGSDWQLAGLATGVFTLIAVAIFAALGQPWQSDRTTYW